jgi:hypothetical protein
MSWYIAEKKTIPGIANKHTLLLRLVLAQLFIWITVLFIDTRVYSAADIQHIENKLA